MTTFSLSLQIRSIRRVMELVGALHQLGYQRLRLTCTISYYVAPGPIWLGNIVPVTCTRRSHGALLITGETSPGGARFLPDRTPHDLPTFSARRMGYSAHWPWPMFVEQAPEEGARHWLGLFPDLGKEGYGADKAYADWYAAMMAATAPSGVLVAMSSGEEVPTSMYVTGGPSSVERFPLPPPGEGN
jgi:hypothetical protein